MNRRGYYRPGTPRFPLEPNTGGQGTPQPGAVPFESYGIHDHGTLPPTSGDIAEQIPFPFDYRVVIPAPASGTTSILIGDALNSAGAGQINTVRVPLGMRAEIDGIYPYIEGVAGVVTQARIPGTGVQILWSIFTNGRPVGDYANIDQVISAWSVASADRPLMYLSGGDSLTCTVRNTDPNGLYTYLGIRIKGLFVKTGRGEERTS